MLLYKIELFSMDPDGSLLYEARNFFRWFIDQGFRVKIAVKQTEGERVCLYLELLEGRRRKGGLYTGEQIPEIFCRQLCEFLAEHILKDWEPCLVRKYVRNHAGGCSEAVCRYLQEKTLHLLHYGEDDTLLPEYVYYEKSCRLRERIQECIPHLKTGRLDVEGFLRFRMPDFLRELEHMARFSVRCWENEQEYEDFVELMREQLGQQGSHLRELHLSYDAQGDIRLWNEQGERISEGSFRRKNVMGMSADDILLRFLFSRAPEKIIWHIGKGEPEKRIRRILQDIFQSRLHFCRDCCLCRSLALLFPYHPGTLR